MKWLDKVGRRRHKAEWHDWFAWHPTLIERQNYEGVVVPGMWVWLETIERRWYLRDSDKDMGYGWARLETRPKHKATT